MTVFEIRDESNKDNLLGYLFYYPKSKRFYTELLGSVDKWNAPFIFWGQIKKGEYSIGYEESLEFVRQRIIPPDRQNIGMILRDNNISEYDEYKLLTLSSGRCAQDDLYLIKIDTDDVADEIKARFELKLKDVIALSDYRVMVFFKNGRTGIADINKLRKDDRLFSRVFEEKHVFDNVKLSPGGNGIEWSGTTIISAEDIYANSKWIDIAYADIINLSKNRVIDTGEAAALLGCTRQYINQLVNQKKLIPIKRISNNFLFLRSDIESEQIS